MSGSKKGKNKIKKKLEWNDICEREKYILYLLIIDVQIGNEDIEKIFAIRKFFGHLFYWGSNLNTIGFCQRCGDTLPLIRNLKIYLGFDLTVSFVKMQMRPRSSSTLYIDVLTLFSSVFFCWSIKWLEKKLF